MKASLSHMEHNIWYSDKAATLQSYLHFHVSGFIYVAMDGMSDVPEGGYRLRASNEASRRSYQEKALVVAFSVIVKS